MNERMSRAGRIKQVAEILDTEMVAMTTYQLTRKMGLAYSKHARELVQDAYIAGKIVGCEDDLKNGLVVRWWWSMKIENPTQIRMEI